MNGREGEGGLRLVVDRVVKPCSLHFYDLARPHLSTKITKLYRKIKKIKKKEGKQDLCGDKFESLSAGHGSNA